MAYTFSRKAEDDLIEIYIEGASLFGVSQADKYHDKIEVMLNLIVYTLDENHNIFIGNSTSIQQVIDVLVMS